MYFCFLLRLLLSTVLFNVRCLTYLFVYISDLILRPFLFTPFLFVMIFSSYLFMAR